MSVDAQGAMQFIKTVTIRVRYGETDRMGVVFNSNYLTWFEVARTELCRLFGTSYRDWEARGFALPVSEAYCRYKQPALYDDDIDIYCRTPIEKILPHSILFEYQLKRSGDRAVIAHGWTKHAFVDGDGKLLKKEHAFQSWLLDAARRHASGEAL